MSRSRGTGRRAFTLVEVLVSLAIFALAAVVLGSAYVNVLLNYHNMRRYNADKTDLATARSLLLSEPDRDRVEEGGEMVLREGGRLRWTAAVEDTGVADLFRVRLEFEVAPDGAPARRETQDFLLLRPTWSDPAERERLRTASRKRLADLRS